MLLFAITAGCGGGGGSDSSQFPLPTSSEDTLPTGARIDVAGKNYFAMTPHSGWAYVRHSDGLPSSNFYREVLSGDHPDDPMLLTETDGTLPYRYRVTSEGIVSIDPLQAATLYPGLFAALPTLLEYPTPFYPVDGIRRVVRQGDMGADLDGDRRNERFRIEFTQTFRGFQTLEVMGKPTVVAAFRSTFAMTIHATSSGQQGTSNTHEDAYFADGVGLVRADRSSTGPDGRPLLAPYTLTLTEATVAGLQISPAAVASELIALPRRDLVYDATRAAYYATVDNGDPTHANRVAIIDSASGVTTYSRVVGANPGPLAVAGDGSVLYVGLQGSGEVLKLELPSMMELARLRLPIEPFNGTQFLPEDISVSPVDPRIFAVSMYRSGARPRHAGVMLVRNMEVAPVRTPAWKDGNVLAFDASGTRLYSYNSEGVGTDLRSYDVSAEGLVERHRIPSVSPSLIYWTRELNLIDGVIMVGGGAFAADAEMTYLGGVHGLHCAKLSAVNKIACQSHSNYNELKVFDATTFEFVGSVAYSATGAIDGWRLVPGPKGQVAIIDSGRLLLFRDALLQ